MDTLFIYWYSYSIIVSSLKPLAMLSHLTQLTIWNYSANVVQLNNKKSIVSLSCYYLLKTNIRTDLYLVPYLITCWNFIWFLEGKFIVAKMSVILKGNMNSIWNSFTTFLKGWPLSLVSHLNQLAKEDLTKENMLSFAHIT